MLYVYNSFRSVALLTLLLPLLFNDHFMREFFDASNAPEMRVDVREKEDAFLLEADLPGVKKEDISLEVNDGVLTISADINQEKKETKEGYVCNERRCGHVERSFNLEGIDVGCHQGRLSPWRADDASAQGKDAGEEEWLQDRHR